MFKRTKKSFELPKSTEFNVGAQSQASSLGEVSGDKVDKQWWTPYVGVFYAFLCSLSFSASSVFVKKLTYINSGQLSTVRNLGTLLGDLPIVIYSTKNIFGPKKYFWLLVIRSIFGGTGLYLNVMTYRYLPLADASIILSTIPALVTLIAHFHLKEPCGFVHVVSIILTVFGILMSIRLPIILQTRSTFKFTSDYVIGLLSGFGCVVVLSLAFVVMRKLKNVHFSIQQLYLGVVGTLESGILTILFSTFHWPHCGGWDSMKVMLVGVLGFLGQSFIALGIQKEAVGIVTTCRSAFDIAIGTVFQIMFFSSIPDFYILGSGLLVIIAISCLGLWKWLEVQPEDSVHRKRLKWFLI